MPSLRKECAREAHCCRCRRAGRLRQSRHSSQPRAGRASSRPARRSSHRASRPIEQAPPSPFPDPCRRRTSPRTSAAITRSWPGSATPKREASRRAAGAAARVRAAAGDLAPARSAAISPTPAMIHKPDWAYVFYFKRDPATDARQIHQAARTSRPRRRATATPNSQAIAKPWVERFMAASLARRATAPTRPTAKSRMDLVVSEAEFREIARARGLAGPRRDQARLLRRRRGRGQSPPRLRPLVRIFAAKRPRARRHQPGAARRPDRAARRLLLRDRPDQARPARLFPARSGARRRTRRAILRFARAGQRRSHLGRVGEQFSWGGPIGIAEDAPMVAELRARCGNAPLEHVGVPQSARLFHVRPWVDRRHRRAPQDQPRRGLAAVSRLPRAARNERPLLRLRHDLAGWRGRRRVSHRPSHGEHFETRTVG